MTLAVWYIVSEEWRAVPRFEGVYEVSDQGRVRSLNRVVVVAGRYGKPVPTRFKGCLLAARTSKAGYRYVNLQHEGSLEGRTVHSLVAEAFIGPRPPGLEVRHLKGIGAGDGVVNLAYGTRSENNLDKREHGTATRGENCHLAYLTDDQVREIRAGRGRQKDIARLYGTTQSNISLIHRRKTWTHV